LNQKLSYKPQLKSSQNQQKETAFSYSLVRDLLQGSSTLTPIQEQPPGKRNMGTSKRAHVFTFSHPFLQHQQALTVSIVSMK